MTGRKMTEEEVFVSAMNAAISGFIAASGNEIIGDAKLEKEVRGLHSISLEKVERIVELATHAAGYAADNWRVIYEDGEEE